MGLERYSIGELAERTGVSRRTVHFYVQRRLIDPPLGRGRGRHYDERHVEQIERVRELQRQGVQLAHMADAGAAFALAEALPTVGTPSASALGAMPMAGAATAGTPAGAEAPATRAAYAPPATRAAYAPPAPRGADAQPVAPHGGMRSRTHMRTVVRIRVAADVVIELAPGATALGPALIAELQSAVEGVITRYRGGAEERAEAGPDAPDARGPEEGQEP
jgi:hypothetical protein